MRKADKTVGMALAVLVLAGCAGIRETWIPRSATHPVPPARLMIDPAESPVSFQWLADDAMLVPPETSTRALASLGNVIARAADGRAPVRIAIYDDAEAWEADRAEPRRVVPRRAEFEKRESRDAVHRFVVLDGEGVTLYERDFRDYPLGPTDEPIAPVP